MNFQSRLCAQTLTRADALTLEKLPLQAAAICDRVLLLSFWQKLVSLTRAQDSGEMESAN